MQTPTVGRGEVRVAVISAGVSEPSSTRLLADRLASNVHENFDRQQVTALTSVVELGPLATDIAITLVGGLTSQALQTAIDTIAQADIVIASTPIYKAGVSGLFKSFIDVLDNDLMVGKVVLLAATAGSPRHAMVLDDHLRPLFAFMRAVTVPTSLFAAPDDWADPSLTTRMKRAAVEAAALYRSGLEDDVLNSSWDAYQHEFGRASARNASSSADPDFDTPLMRLASGEPYAPGRPG
jgi:FMN reductase